MRCTMPEGMRECTGVMKYSAYGIVGVVVRMDPARLGMTQGPTAKNLSCKLARRPRRDCVTSCAPESKAVCLSSPLPPLAAFFLHTLPRAILHPSLCLYPSTISRRELC